MKKTINRWLHKQGSAREIGWKIVGYTMLAFCTSFFSASLAFGRPTAAANFAAFCFVLAIALGWHRTK